MKIYLAGPINASTDAEANDWREYVSSRLPNSWTVYNPMDRDYRGKEDEEYKAIVEADMEDVGNSDVLFAYCPKPSVGTSMEVFIAYTMKKRVIVVVPGDGPISPWLRYHASFLAPSLDDAIAWLSSEDVFREATD